MRLIFFLIPFCDSATWAYLSNLRAHPRRQESGRSPQLHSGCTASCVGSKAITLIFSALHIMKEVTEYPEAQTSRLTKRFISLPAAPLHTSAVCHASLAQTFHTQTTAQCIYSSYAMWKLKKKKQHLSCFTCSKCALLGKCKSKPQLDATSYPLR